MELVSFLDESHFVIYPRNYHRPPGNCLMRAFVIDVALGGIRHAQAEQKLAVTGGM